MYKVHVQQTNVIGRGGLGQNFRPGNRTLIQAIPYNHNKFWNMDNPISLLVSSSSQGKSSFIVIPLHVGTYSGTKRRASQDQGTT